jgi:hypothetical protein
MRYLLIALLFIPLGVNANEVLDEKIERFCMEHPKANERFFNETH